MVTCNQQLSNQYTACMTLNLVDGKDIDLDQSE